MIPQALDSSHFHVLFDIDDHTQNKLLHLSSESLKGRLQ
jgi:hypothetical protein